jgi:transposase
LQSIPHGRSAALFELRNRTVHDAVAYLVAWGLEHRVLGEIRAIGVDEIQYGKGHKYLTLVYQIDLGCTRLLWIGKERTVKTFREFFAMIGPEVSAKIAFCSAKIESGGRRQLNFPI